MKSKSKEFVAFVKKVKDQKKKSSTAAHCVNNKRKTVKQIAFVGNKSGVKPFGFPQIPIEGGVACYEIAKFKSE